MSSVHLFDEFPPISTDEWDAQIRRDLKGGDYGEMLLWHLGEGLTVRPYYRAEDAEALERPAGDAIDMPAGWKLRQDIRTPDLEAAIAHARSAIDGGIDILGIDLRVENGRCRGMPILDKESLSALLADVSRSGVSLHLNGGVLSPTLFACILESWGDQVPALSIQFDPVSESARTGRRVDDLLDLAADMLRTVSNDGLSDARVLSVSSGAFHDAGATALQETAMLLAAMSELLVQMIDRGLQVERVLDRLILETSISSSYFVEIARLRALRLVVRQLIDVFAPGKNASMPPIHGATSMRNATLFDPHANMLRSTTEAASAVIGGCDVVSIHPFDDVGGRFDEFSYRIARNIQHVLRFEAGFGRVADPAAGSYFVDVLTDALARRSWQRFQEIESEGGLFAALENGFIHRQLDASRTDEQAAFAERRRVLVGTNDYPTPSEHRAADAPPREAGIEIPAWDGPPDDVWNVRELQRRVAESRTFGVPKRYFDDPSAAEPLPRQRIAEPLERRRLRTERHGCEPRVLIAPFGDPASRSRRATFAANFLGCGGFAIDAPVAFDDVDDIVRAIRTDPPDILVYSADDALYGEYLVQIQHYLNESTLSPVRILVAQPNISDHIETRLFDLIIHGKSDLIRVLDELHRRLGITGAGDESTGARADITGARDEITGAEITGARDEITGVHDEITGVRDERDEEVGR